MSTVFDPLLLGSLSLKVLAAGQLTPQGLAAVQAERLALLLQSVAVRSPFYREVLKGRDPARVALHDLPVVTKAELVSRFDDWVSDPRLHLDELRAFVSDRRRIGEPWRQRYIVWESSGTSGEPAIFVQDARTLALYDALEALRRSAPRPWQRLLDPMCVTERIAFIGATTGHFASEVSAQRLRRLNRWMANAMRSFSILTPTADLMAQIDRFDPTVIVTYPSVASLLAEASHDGALKARPKEIWTGGETLSPAAQQHVAQTFGCTISNSYGASEFLPIGWECSQGRMHANTDWVLIEPVDAHHRPVPAGQLSHTTLITHLANETQPIIRYDLGDRIAIHAGRCACGSSLPVIEVQGRSDDSLHLRGIDGRRMTLLPLALTTLLEDEAQVFEFQLVQRDDSTLVLRLPLSDEAARPVLARCESVWAAYAARQRLAPVKLVAETGCPLARGRSGKVKRVVASSAASTARSRPRVAAEA
ncbi:MAG TPA: AMP-binding protein [Albitalea sp.]|uniref:phenylacetate--CoA ligase family protein n=1 Tax=Piscinibacter sp. TaxID=1903157 RepID=UPI002ED25C78